MNLELIKKYEKEFLHMLHGGSLMFKPNDKQVWFDSTESPIDWTVEGLYVIDDMYSTYRKALAEGKTVQYKMGIIANSNEPKWFDLTPKEFNSYKVKDFWDKDLGNIKGVENYRIKPDEPKFKVGDWITVNGPTGTFTECISGIADDTYTLSGTNICYKSQASKWEPKEGEVCVFWDDNWVTKAIIIKFNYINNSNQYTAIDNTCWDNCMPFTGALPPHIKD